MGRNLSLVFQILFKLFRHSPFWSTRLVLGSIIVGATEVTTLGMLYPIINHVTGETESKSFFMTMHKQLIEFLNFPNTLTYNLILFLGVSFCSTCLFMIISWDRSTYIYRWEYLIKGTLLDKLSASSWSSFSRLNHGRILNSLTRESDFIRLAYDNLLTSLSNIIIVLSFIVMLLIIDPFLALVSFATSGVTFLIIGPILTLTKKLGDRFARDSEQYSQIIVNLCRGFKNIKVLALEGFLNQLVSKNIKRVAKGYFYSNGVLAAFRYRFFELLGMFSLCLLLYISIEVTETPKTKMLLMLTILIKATPLASIILNQISIVFASLPSLEFVDRIKGECHDEVKSDDKQITELKAIEVNQVSYAYDNSEPILSDFSYRFERGKFYAICGESGAGKTTLLDLIANLLQPSQGQVRYDGLLGEQINKQSLSQRMGYLSQSSFIFEGTLLENITWGLTDYKTEDVERAMKLAQLDTFYKEKGPDFKILESGQNLSGGQMQRIAFARMHLRNYDFILLDEPTASLDQDTEKKLIQDLHTLHGKVAVIAITHREEYLKYVDDTVIIKNTQKKG